MTPRGRDLRWSNKFFAYYHVAEENKDIRGFRSTYETRLDYHAGFAPHDRVFLRAFLREPKKAANAPEDASSLSLGGVELGYRRPLTRADNGAFQFYAQLYHGYNETWRFYDERVTEFRLGFMVR